MAAFVNKEHSPFVTTPRGVDGNCCEVKKVEIELLMHPIVHFLRLRFRSK